MGGEGSEGLRMLPSSEGTFGTTQCFGANVILLQSTSTMPYGLNSNQGSLLVRPETSPRCCKRSGPADPPAALRTKPGHRCEAPGCPRSAVRLGRWRQSPAFGARGPRALGAAQRGVPAASGRPQREQRCNEMEAIKKSSCI